MGRGGAILTPNELVLTFGDLHLCVKFGENRQRNATVRVMTHGQTDRQTDRQTQTDFIICSIATCYSYGTDNYTNSYANKLHKHSGKKMVHARSHVSCMNGTAIIT